MFKFKKSHLQILLVALICCAGFCGAIKKEAKAGELSSVALEQTQSYFFVSNKDSGKLYVFDKAEDIPLVKTIIIGNGPSHMIVYHNWTDNNDYLLIALSQAKKIKVINAKTLEVIGDINTPKMPYWLAQDSDKIFASVSRNNGSSFNPFIVWINEKDMLTASSTQPIWSNGAYFYGNEHLLADSGNRFLFAGNVGYSPDNISKFSIESLGEIKFLLKNSHGSLGSNGKQFIFNEDKTKIYFAASGSAEYNLQVVNPVNLTKEADLSLGAYPNAVGFDEHYVYAGRAAFNSDAIKVYDKNNIFVRSYSFGSGETLVDRGISATNTGLFVSTNKYLYKINQSSFLKFAIYDFVNDKAIEQATYPDFIVSDLKIEQRSGDSGKYIYATVENIGERVLPVNYSILDVKIEDLDTGDVYKASFSGDYVKGYKKEVKSNVAIKSKSTNSYRLKATVDSVNYLIESNETNNTFEKTINVNNPIIQCTDSDGGQNYYTKGTLNSTQGRAFTDLCINNNSIREYWCAEGAEFSSLGTQCPNGGACKDGACILDSKVGQTIGDADGDGKITKTDSDLVSKIDAGLIAKPANICAMDVDKNNKVDIFDALFIDEIVAGKKSSPGACLPDLVITDIKINTTAPTVIEGKKKTVVSFIVTYKNIGNVDINIPFYYVSMESSPTADYPAGFKGGRYVDVANSPIKTNIEYTTSVGDYLLTYGTSLLDTNFTFYIDRFIPFGDANDNIIKESNENNNVFTKTINLRSTDSGACSDSDGGQNYFSKGEASKTVNGYKSGSFDTCLDANTLYEAYCSNVNVLNETYKCPNGCKDGACVGASTGSVYLNTVNINNSILPGTKAAEILKFNFTLDKQFVLDKITIECSSSDISNLNLLDVSKQVMVKTGAISSGNYINSWAKVKYVFNSLNYLVASNNLAYSFKADIPATMVSQTLKCAITSEYSAKTLSGASQTINISSVVSEVNIQNNQLDITYNANNPKSSLSLNKGLKNYAVLWLNMHANSNTDLTITGVTFKKYGSLSNNYISKISLYGNLRKLIQTKDVMTSDTISFRGLNYQLRAGETHDLILEIDMTDNVESNKDFYFYLTDLQAIDAHSSTVKINATLPLQGNLMRVAESNVVNKPDLTITSVESQINKSQIIGNTTYDVINFVVKYKLSSNIDLNKNFYFGIETDPTDEYINGFKANSNIDYIKSSTLTKANQEYSAFLGAGYSLPKGKSLNTAFKITIDNDPYSANNSNLIDESNENNNTLTKIINIDATLTPIVISNIELQYSATHKPTEAFIVWETNVSANAFVAYVEKDKAYIDKDKNPSSEWQVVGSGKFGKPKETDTLSKSHAIKIQNLKSSTTYLYYVGSLDVNGNSTMSTAKEFITANTTQNKSCTDSDGGQNYFSKGEASKTVNGYTTGAVDTCLDANTLREAYCSNVNVLNETYKCPNGCKDGACLSTPQVNSYRITDTMPITVKPGDIVRFLGNFPEKYPCCHFDEHTAIVFGDYYAIGENDFIMHDVKWSKNEISVRVPKLPDGNVAITIKIWGETFYSELTYPSLRILSNDISSSLESIHNAAKNLNENKFDQILAEIKTLKDIIKEQDAQIKYLSKLTQGVQKLSEKVENAINNFITYGVDDNTKRLGAGERAAVMYSYKAAFDKLPETDEELADAIKIANGRWPSITNQDAENKAKEHFKKIYKRAPDMNNGKDNAAVTIMTYGLRQRAENRNMESERSGIAIFKGIYKKLPETTEDWNIMQAITYSGAAR